MCSDCYYSLLPEVEIYYLQSLSLSPPPGMGVGGGGGMGGGKGSEGGPVMKMYIKMNKFQSLSVFQPTTVCLHLCLFLSVL